MTENFGQGYQLPADDLSVGWCEDRGPSRKIFFRTATPDQERIEHIQIFRCDPIGTFCDGPGRRRPAKIGADRLGQRHAAQLGGWTPCCNPAA
jgi:hypothetical protein